MQGVPRMEPHIASLVIDGLKQAHVRFVIALPDTLLRGVYAAADKDPELRYIPVTNEAEGASIAAGTWSVGARSVLVMENSGLRSACEPLARLGLATGIPVTMLMPYRGDLGEQFEWGIDHAIWMEPMLQVMRIPYKLVDRQEDIVHAVSSAVIHAVSSLYHTAVIFRYPLIKDIR